MPFTAEQIAKAGKASMDYRVRKKPQDLYNTDRPLLGALQRTKKSFPGAVQFIVEQLRKTNDANFQWFGPNDQVTYNNKDTLENANFEWRSAHDGFFFTEEELLQNRISITDNPKATPTKQEAQQFVNMMDEAMDTLFLGFKEKFDFELHLDGTQDADALVGLDALVATDPTTGTVGGIDRATAGNEYWRNQASLAIATGTPDNLTEEMEKVWRDCTRVGGYAPNLILMGRDFYDAYRKDNKDNLERQIMVPAKGGTGLDGSVTALGFQGVECQWDPVLDDLQAATGEVTTPWDKRCYFLNTRFLKLRPAEGQDMVTRTPPRVYDRYTHYWGLTWRGGLTITHPGAMAVLSIA